LTITGGGGADIIQGGTGADIITGGTGADVYVFASTAALNGIDVYAANVVIADDKLDFSNFLSGGSFHSSTATEHNGSADVDITNKVVLAATTDGAVAQLNTAAKIVAEMQGLGNAFELQPGQKGILIAGDNSAATAGAQIWFIDDTLDSTSGTVTANDVVQVATVTIDIDTLDAGNFTFY